MPKLAPFLIILFSFSCKAKNDNLKEITGVKVFKRYDYIISIQQGNGFYGQGEKFVLNNSRIIQYDSTSDDDMPLGNPLTLYYIDYELTQTTKDKNIQTFKSVDTTEIRFSKELSDTLFLLTRDYLTHLELSNFDTIGKLTPIITDDSHGLVELDFGGLKLSSSISSINNPTMRTKQMDTLLHFINKFRPRR